MTAIPTLRRVHLSTVQAPRVALKSGRLVQSPFTHNTAATMAKSKNSSQHNQNKKAHKNGIKKPKTNRYPSLNGTDPKFRRNHRHALHGTMKALKEVKEGKRDAA
ncbi:hypothetical protein JMJ35_001459 [Cladonia borealis]|uniref:60S ribosomal protein L29 n=1 Tax=Cladonia borealis TaxID=184061 RepID=A0AA39R5W8_9LECA|nr:hypothetical protein JMJ35_001459 [Cladonia borealis]